MSKYVRNLKMCAHLLISLLFFVAYSQQINVIGSVNTTRAKVEKNDGKGSLVFVFDTTGSMFNDLRQLREGAEMILKTALEDSNVIADFVFVPFHDPSVGPVTVTKNKQVFKSALNIVSVYGGGDCPEKSLMGIQLALNVSRPQSFIYVFTDATASDHKLVGMVLDSIQRKQSQVVFVLTGHCNDVDKPHFKVYQQIAAASSGQLFNLNKTSVHKVLDFVRSSIRRRSVNLASTINPPGYNYTQAIPVDRSVDEVTVSVSGAKPVIKVIKPSGEELTGPPQLIKTLDLSEIMIVKVLEPEPGRWSVTVGAAQQYSLRVVALSNLTFTHGFSVQAPADMDHTSYRPLQGTYNHMLIALSENNSSLQMNHIQLLSLNGTPFFELPLRVLNKDKQLYLADAFIPPEEFFNIAIVGRDEYGQEVRRVGPTAVQVKPPGAPLITLPKKIEARSGERVVLTCHVDSLVPISAMWTRENIKITPTTTSLQSTSLELTIPSLSEAAAGEYRCVASNSAGAAAALVALHVVVDPPRVTISPKNMTVTEGEHLNMSCSVFSEVLLHRSSLSFSGSARNLSIDAYLEPTIDGYYALNKTIHFDNESDSGVYSCEAANRAGKSVDSTYIKVQSKPSAQIIGPHTLAIRLHTDTQLVCQIENALNIRWLDKHKEAIETYDVNGSFTAVLDVKNVTEDGVWTCMAIRDDYEASDSVEVTVLIKPHVHISGAHNVTLLNGSQYQIHCDIVAKPEPRIIWHMETERFLLSDTTNPQPNVYKSRLTLDSEKYPMNGTYFCIGENSQGIGEDSVTVHVRDKMRLLHGFNDTSVELYSQVDFPCNVTSFPPPTVTWYHNNTEILNSNSNISNNTLHIQKVDFTDLGEYKCIADNTYENVTVTGVLTVHGLSKPIILKRITKIVAKLGDNANITCRILKSSPEPTITWRYKSTAIDNYTILPKEIDSEGNKYTIIKQNIKKEHTGVYRCTADNAMGRDEYDVELIVQFPPELQEPTKLSHPEGPLQVKCGDAVELPCGAAGLPPPLVTWTKDHLPIAFAQNIYLANDSNLILENATEFDAGVYSCNASNSLGFTSKNFTVTVYLPPTIIAHGDNETSVLEGQLVELPCAAAGVPAPRLRWRHRGGALAGRGKYVDDYGLRFVANLTDFGEYTCLASNEHGTASWNYTVYVWVPPRLVPPLEELREVMVGVDIHLQCDAVGFPVPHIYWEFGDVPLEHNATDISFDNTGSLNITNSTYNHEGIYVCTAQNIAGAMSKSFFLTVNEPPKIANDNYTGPYIASVLDVALTVSCKASGKPRPYVYWVKDGFYLDEDPRYTIDTDGSLTINSPSEDLSGDYSCEARNKFGMETKKFQIEIYSIPSAAQEARGVQGALAAAEGARGVQGVQGALAAAEGARVVQGVQGALVAAEGGGALLRCPVRGGRTVQWYKDAVLISNGSLFISNVSRHNESVYACVASNAVGSVHANVMLNVVWKPKLLVQDDENVEIVKGEDHYLDCETDAKPRGETRWYLNSKLLSGENKEKLKLMNVQTKHGGVYKCIVKNEYGAAFKRFNVNVLVPPFISQFDLLDIELKSGIDATLECNAIGFPTPNITWTFNNTNWILENATIKTTNTTQQSQGYFQCIASNSAGSARVTYRVAVVCGARLLQLLLFVDGTGLDVDRTADLTLGTKARIACKATGNPPPIIQWIRHGNTLSENGKNIYYADLVFPDVNIYDAGEYTCVASNEGGTDDKIIKVNVLEPPRIHQTLQQNENRSENPISLEVISGQAFYLQCHPYGNPYPEVYWLKDGLPLNFYNESMVSRDYGEVAYAKNAMNKQVGNYTCVARNTVGETSVVYLVDVLVPPSPLKDNVRNVSVWQHSTLNMSCADFYTADTSQADPSDPSPPRRPHPAPAALWLKHPYTDIEETPRIHLTDDNYTLTITDVEVADSGKYSCIMTNKVGTTELVYDVLVLKPPEIKKNKGNDTIEDHIVLLRRSIVLKCEVDGNPPPKITWFKNIQEVSAEQPNVQSVRGASVLALWAARAADAAQYACAAASVAGVARRRYDVKVKVPGTWSSWSPWSYCDATCGGGQQRRQRTCHYVDHDNHIIDKTNQPDKIILDESECKGGTVDKRKCHMPSCEEEVTWSRWSPWSSCSASCGGATQVRARDCRAGACLGDNIQIRKCTGLPPCTVQMNQIKDDDDEDTAVIEENVVKQPNSDYLPEAVFELSPEMSSTEYDDHFNFRPEAAQPKFYEVRVTSNLDGSAQGDCPPGHTSVNNTCQDIDECSLGSNACHRTQVCEDVRGGYRCGCPHGYRALAAGAQCLDINECVQGVSGCERACVNTAGGFVCACPPRLRLRADRRTCGPPSYRKLYSYEELIDKDPITRLEYPEKKRRH